MRTRTSGTTKQGRRTDESARRDENHEPYDIYIRAQVDALKAENSELRRRLAEEVHENALLHAALHRARNEYWKEAAECNLMNLS